MSDERMAEVLVCGGAAAVVDSLRVALARGGDSVTAVLSAGAAVDVVSAGNVDVLVIDDSVADVPARALADLIERRHPEVAVLVLAARASIHAALGGHEMARALVKPVSAALLREAVRGALQQRALSTVSRTIADFSRNHPSRALPTVRDDDASAKGDAGKKRR